ncbi:hypothetical protein [Nostoc sp.]
MVWVCEALRKPHTGGEVVRDWGEVTDFHDLQQNPLRFFYLEGILL